MNSRRSAAASAMLAAGLGFLLACSRAASPPAEANNPALEELIARCRRVMAARPGVAFEHAELALVFEANGRWVEAAQHYAEACELEPDEPLWATHLAICQAEAGDFMAARRTLESGVTRFPDSAAILQRLAVAQLEEGDFVRARDNFGALAKLEGHAVDGWTGVAEVELACAAVESALAAAERALALDPSYRLPRYLRAVCLRELGRESEAALEFELVGTAQRRLIGDSWSAHAADFAVGFEARFSRAVGLLDEDHAAEALAAFEALAGERPRDVRTLGNLAMARAATGQLAAALSACDAALALAPDAANLHAARARILLASKRNIEALAAARRASQLDPHEADNFEVLGHALAAGGETRSALGAWEEALRLDPSNSERRQRLEPLRRLRQ